MKKTMFGILLIFSLFFFFSSFGEMRTEDSEQEERYLIPLMEALRDRDKEGMYDLWVDKKRTEENDECFEFLFDLWEGTDWKMAEKTGKDIRKQEGKTPGASIYHYKVQAENRKVELSFSVSDASQEIDWIRILNQEDHAQRMPVGLIMAALAIIEIGFSLYVSFLCVKNREKWWGIWLAFILFVYGGISVSWNQDVAVGFFVYLLAFPRLANTWDGGIHIFLSVPVGAVWYFMKCKRKMSSERG